MRCDPIALRHLVSCRCILTKEKAGLLQVLKSSAFLCPIIYFSYSRVDLPASLTIINRLRVHIMIHHAVVGHLFVLRSRLAVVRIRVNGDAAARCEFAPYFNEAGVHQLDQIVHDDIHTILVEITMVAEAEQVQLERFALDHFDIRNVADIDRCKVWLTRNRAQAGELRAVEFYKIIAVRMFVIKALQNARIIFKRIFYVLVAQQRHILHLIRLSHRLLNAPCFRQSRSLAVYMNRQFCLYNSLFCLMTFRSQLTSSSPFHPYYPSNAAFVAPYQRMKLWKHTNIIQVIGGTDLVNQPLITSK